MSQAEQSPTPSDNLKPEAAPSFTDDPETVPGSLPDIIFAMENRLNEGLCLTDALISLMEGRRGNLRTKPDTVYFLLFEVLARFERLREEWEKLFRLHRAST